MAHLIVRFPEGHENESEEETKDWHLYATGVGDAEFTACGMAVVDYKHETKSKDRGGITCEMCLKHIRYYKTIKL